MSDASASPLPRPGRTAPTRKAAASPPAALNVTMRWLLRSPLSGMVHGQLMLLTVTGRKTGNEYTFPVQYVADGDTLWVITGGHEDKTWWRNLRSEAPVTVLLRRERRAGRAQAFTHAERPELVEAGLRNYQEHYPKIAAKLGAPPGDEDAFRTVAATTVMVRIELD